MDRMDLFIEVPALKYEKLVEPDANNASASVKENIEKARAVQKARFANDHILVNAEMNIQDIKKYCSHDVKSQNLLKQYVDSGKLSARGYHRVLKVARSIADLAGSEYIAYGHIAESLMYRLKT